MSAFLFGVGPTDPITYAVVSGVLAAAALLATYLPASRAARVRSHRRLASGHVAQAVYLAFVIFITVIRDAPET